MSNNFYYTHSTEFKGSSVLDSAYYSDETKRLYVCFHNGSVAGYGQVSKESFDRFCSAHSAGQYYNTWIKGAYPTLHSNVIFVPVTEDDKTGVHSVPASTAGKNDQPVFVLSVKVDGTLEFTVNASDAKAAIERVEEILKNSSKGANLNYTVEGVVKS